MTNRRTYYFPANGLHVTTGLLPNGEYDAFRQEIDEGRVRGYGHTRLDAIADLVERVGEQFGNRPRGKATLSSCSPF
jgi:hypothetical protein